MRALADAAGYFAPELEVLSFPAWDCLPYDRSSPSLRSTSERLATLHALQRKADKPQLLVTTVNAATQRTLTPFRVRQLVARLVPGERIDLHRLTALLQANGYVRTDAVADAGEFAVRGGGRGSVRRPGRPRRPFSGGREGGVAPRLLRRRDRRRAPLRPGDQAHHRNRRGRLHLAARLGDAARRRQHQAFPLALSGEVR